MFSTIRNRLLLSYIIIILVVIGIAGGAVFVYLIRNPIETRRELQRLRLISKLVQDRINISIITNQDVTPQQIVSNVKRTDRTLNVRIIFYDPDGNIILDSRDYLAQTPPPIDALRRKSANSLPVYKTKNGVVWLYYLSKINNGYSLLVTSPLPKVKVLSVFKDEFVVPFGRGIAIGIVLSLFLAIWISQWVSRPLHEMITSAKAIASGEYHEVPLEGPEDVRELAEAINEMSSQIQASEKVQREFIANVSHDLKTPLTSIQGFSEAILDGTIQSEDELIRAAKVINTESQRMYKLVLELLELARLDSGIDKFNIESLNLESLLNDVVKDLSNLAKQRSIKVIKEFRNIPVIQGDPEKLFRVFYNLVDNAIKYSSEKSEVIIRTEMEGNFVKVFVIDTGSGIPEDELDRVFERFYQVDKSRKGGDSRGVGLGLAIAKGIVEAHKGNIFAINRKSLDKENVTGSVFIVELPISLNNL